MAPVTQPVPAKRPAGALDPAVGKARSQLSPSNSQSSGDGTNQLLQWGGGTFATGIFFALLTKFLFGGIGPQGPHTNSGWMALIVTMMCLPFGFLLSLLGGLKWLRNRNQSKR